MELKKRNNGFLVEASCYTLGFDAAEPMHVDLRFNNGLGGKLFVASGCDKDEWIDSLISLSAPEVKETAEATEIVFVGKTNCWDRVEYTFTCLKDRVLYGYTVHGRGRIENARFFEGFLNNDPRMEEAFYPYFQGAHRSMVYKRPWKYFAQSSTPTFEKLYSFSINSSDTREFMYFEDMVLRVNGNRRYLGGDWLVTPPPYIYLLNNEEETHWLSVGLLVPKGENNFCEFQYLGGKGFGFNLTYDGYTQVEGSWASPKMMIAMHGTTDPYAALDDYVSYLRENGHVAKKDRSVQPRWWHEPIFGGWGEQMFLSDYFKVYRMKEKPEGCGFAGPGHCTREAYDKMLATLEEKGIAPTILIVDNRWFEEDRMLDIDEQAWPDMKGWIAEQHEKGRKVILWVSMWWHQPGHGGADLSEGLSLRFDESNAYHLEINPDVFYPACGLERKKVRKPNPHLDACRGGNYAVDPLNPEYDHYLREKINYLISPEGLNADGFEFDYTHALWVEEGNPRGLGLQQWGAELLHTLTKIYHDAAKAAKEDALIITHTFNPYFDDCIDMLRLQDIYTDRAEVNGQFGHRARLAQAVCPDCAIHTDQHPMPSLHAWRKYMPYQQELGNPCLYYVTGIETTYEEFEECDWQMLRDVWGEYDKKLTAQYGPKK